MPNPPVLDRSLLNRDLLALSRLLVTALTPWAARLPFPLNRMVSPEVLTREISAACSRLLASPDAELAVLIDAAGRELGALRGALAAIDEAYLEAHPEVSAAAYAVAGRLL